MNSDAVFQIESSSQIFWNSNSLLIVVVDLHVMDNEKLRYFSLWSVFLVLYFGSSIVIDSVSYFIGRT